jgi:hypothetical protein
VVAAADTQHLPVPQAARQLLDSGKHVALLHVGPWNLPAHNTGNDPPKGLDRRRIAQPRLVIEQRVETLDVHPAMQQFRNAVVDAIPRVARQARQGG